jgi:transcription elongation factor Elf1
MAEQASKTETKEKPQEEIKFHCRRCGRERPLSEMRSVTRFLPVLIVCKDCARELR